MSSRRNLHPREEAAARARIRHTAALVDEMITLAPKPTSDVVDDHLDLAVRCVAPAAAALSADDGQAEMALMALCVELLRRQLS